MIKVKNSLETLALEVTEPSLPVLKFDEKGGIINMRELANGAAHSDGLHSVRVLIEPDDALPTVGDGERVMLTCGVASLLFFKQAEKLELLKLKISA